MEDELAPLRARGVAPWRLALGERVESRRAQTFVVGVILVNAVLLALQTDAGVMARAGDLVVLLDQLCLSVFVVELVLKVLVHGRGYPRSGWRVFDLLVVAVALVPGAGPWAVLRSLRVLRVLRLLTVVPALRRVVAAFLHAIPGLMGVMAVMAVFFFTAGVLATELFGSTHPQWFGSLGASLYTLFQVMTLESWSMGIVRPVMEEHPVAWAFFVPFIIVATFTILNLFIGIIVSTMQELTESEGGAAGAGAPAATTAPSPPDAAGAPPAALAALERLEAEVRALRSELAARELAAVEPVGGARSPLDPSPDPR